MEAETKLMVSAGVVLLKYFRVNTCENNVNMWLQDFYCSTIAFISFLEHVKVTQQTFSQPDSLQYQVILWSKIVDWIRWVQWTKINFNFFFSKKLVLTNNSWSLYRPRYKQFASNSSQWTMLFVLAQLVEKVFSITLQELAHSIAMATREQNIHILLMFCTK